MHDRLQTPKRKLLGTLQTKRGSVIVNGGAEFDDEGRGFFIPEPGVAIKPVVPGENGIIEVTTGELISIRDLSVAPSTCSLPRRYTFIRSQMLRSQRTV
jgi:hypothetical protein